MGRSDKMEEDGKSRAIGAHHFAGLTSPPVDGTAAALGGLQAAAAVEAFLKNSQGLSSATGGMTSDASLFLGGFSDPLRALVQNPALLSRIAKNALPRSAPGSSLLPPIPTEGLSPQSLMALQTRLATIGASPASLIGPGSSTGSLGHQSLQSGSGLSAVHQLLAAQAAAAAPKSSMASSIASSVAPNMQNWSLQRLGK